MRNLVLRRLFIAAAIAALSAFSPAVYDETKIHISKALGSPTLTIRYSGANAALIELRLNGESFGTRTVSDAVSTGETTFTLDVLALKDGDNEIEIRLYDKAGRLVGTQKTIVATEDEQPAVFLSSPKIGASLQGPVELKVGFGKELKNAYVSFFVNNQFKSMTNYPPYSFIWDTTREPNGWHEIEAWAVDETSNTFKTKKVRVFVNNPGGRTFRNLPSPKATALVPPPIKPTPQPAKSATAELLDLITLPNPVNPEIGNGAAAQVKATQLAYSAAFALTPAPLAPGLSEMLANNPVAPFIETAILGIKPSPLPKAVASGSRVLTPTGKRNLAPEPSTPFVEPVTESAAESRLEEGPAPEAVARPVEPVAPSAPAPAKAPVVESQAKAIVLAPIGLNRLGTADVALLPDLSSAAAPAEAEAPKEPSTSVRITKGVKLPVNTTFKLFYNAKELMFDVAPYVAAGVPVTPFRHLIEGAGGQVYWTPEVRGIQAKAEGQQIVLRIGEKVANVNKLPVEMELAPFLEKGRTIVALSFISDALKVDIEYDKKSGHVLITKR